MLGFEAEAEVRRCAVDGATAVSGDPVDASHQGSFGPFTTHLSAS